MEKRRIRAHKLMSHEGSEHVMPRYMVFVWRRGFLLLVVPYIFLDYIMYAYRYRKGSITVEILKFCRLIQTPEKYGNIKP